MESDRFELESHLSLSVWLLPNYVASLGGLSTCKLIENSNNNLIELKTLNETISKGLALVWHMLSLPKRSLLLLLFIEINIIIKIILWYRNSHEDDSYFAFEEIGT